MAPTHLKSEFFWKVKNFLVFQEILGKSRNSWKVRKFLDEKSEKFWKVRKIVESQKNLGKSENSWNDLKGCVSEENLH